ncbi:MAG: HNH endonuclease signature motif containing protein [Candidatus Aenigmatarchaeota archaeon]
MQFDVKIQPPYLYPKRKRKVKSSIRKKLMYKPRKCVYCRKHEAMHLHHVRGFAKGGSDKESNLVPLCANCHYKIHHGIITTEQLKRRLGIKTKLRKKSKRKRRQEYYRFELPKFKPPKLSLKHW